VVVSPEPLAWLTTGRSTERHVAVVPAILGEVHRGHATGPKLTLDAVAIPQCESQPIQDRCHL
jgi:hypothetical protein